MDDLLALMEDDPPEEPELKPEHKVIANDTPRRKEAVERAHIAAKPAAASSSKRCPSHTLTKSRTSQAEISIDARLGIRMLKRKIGSIDLIDIMASNPYHSPATLVKMTTGSLNQLLQDPSPVIDAATVIGQTNLLTIGIVFTNTGTRISKNGRAFSILGIGNLVTGPIVTVFLFGDAYSKHSKDSVPGTVVGILNPSILPPNENASAKQTTSLSLSVRDVRQFLPVAQAQDFGICKGVGKSKRPDGRLAEYYCKNHVDTRVGPFCTKHAKQANVKNGKTASDQSFLQKHKQEFLRPAVGTNLLPNQSTLPTAFLGVAKPARNTLLSKTPMHMVKGQGAKIQTKIFNHDPSSMDRKNPYQKKPQLLAKPALKAQIPMGQRPKKNWLSEGTTSSKSNAKKRAINRDGGRYDGTVMVPKAHKLFRATTNKAMQQAQHATARETAEERAMAIRDRQRSLVGVLQQKSSDAPDNQLQKSLQRSRAKKAAATKNTSNFFADMEIDVNAVLNRKSRFEVEAKAEDYARKRQAVIELEKKEEGEMKREAKKNKASGKGTSNSKVQREWRCNTCKRTFGVDPKMCKRRGHKVKVLRSIEEVKTLTEKRLKLQDKKVEDGGIKLGAGVEWTKYDRVS